MFQVVASAQAGVLEQEAVFGVREGLQVLVNVMHEVLVAHTALDRRALAADRTRHLLPIGLCRRRCRCRTALHECLQQSLYG